MINLQKAFSDFCYDNSRDNCALHSMYEAFAYTAHKKNKAPEEFTRHCPIIFYPDDSYRYAPRSAFWYIFDNFNMDIEGYGNLDELFDDIDGYTPWFGLLLMNSGATALFWYPEQTQEMREWELLDDFRSPKQWIAQYEKLKEKEKPSVSPIGRFFNIDGSYTQKHYSWIHTEYGLAEKKIVPDVIKWCSKFDISRMMYKIERLKHGLKVPNNELQLST